MQRNLLPKYQFPSMNGENVSKTHIVRTVNNVDTVKNTVINNVHDKNKLCNDHKDHCDGNDPSVDIQELLSDEHALYSMKFPKPKTLTPNLSPPTGLDDLQLSYIWVQRITGKDKKYDQHIASQVNTLMTVKREREKEKRNAKVSLNNISKKDNPPTLGYTPIKLRPQGPPVLALVDTGASLSFLHISLVEKYGLTYKKQSMTLSTANGSDDHNIQGVLTTRVFLTDFTKETFPITLKFLICKNLNGNSAILGSNFTNTAFVSAHLIILPYENSLRSVPIYQRSSAPDAFFIYVPMEDYDIPPSSTSEIKCKILQKDFSTLIANDLATQGLLYNVRTELAKNGLKPSCLQHDINHDLFSLQVSNISNANLNISKNSVLGEILLSFSGQQQGFDRSTFSQPKQETLPQQQQSLFSVDTPDDVKRQPKDIIDNIESQTFLEPLSEFTQTLTLDMIDYSECPDQYKQEAKAISHRHPFAFATNKLDVGDSSGANDYFVPIDTIPGKIARDKRRVLSGYHLDYAKQVIQKYVDKGLIVEGADGEFRTNIFMVAKKLDPAETFTKIDKIGSPPPPRLRCVFDLRSLNRIIKVKHSTNLPTIDTIHASLMNKYIIQTDVNNAFSSMTLKKEDRHKCAFYLNERLYTAVLCPQGLLSAPYHWEKISKIIFSQKRFEEVRRQLPPAQQELIKDCKVEDFLITYADDNYIFSEDISLLLILYECFLLMCERGKIKLNPNKTILVTTHCHALGVNISTMDGTKSLSEKKITALIAGGPPNSLFELQSKLCSFLYVLKYLPYLQTLVFGLALQLRLKRFVWDDFAKEAYEMLCLLVRLHLKLCVPQKHERLCLTTDGSRYALAGCLFVERNGELEICQCTSKINSLTHYHRNSFVLEIMALIHSLTTFWPYLVNCETDIFAMTDAKSLLYNKRMRTHSLASQNLCDYLVNQLSQLPNLILLHIIGPANIVSDILSRSFEARFEHDQHPLSKEAALNLPPLPDGFILTAEDISAFLNAPTMPESSDIWQRNKKHSLPPKLDDIFSKLQRPTMESRIYQLNKILKGWADDFVGKKSATLSSLITTINNDVEKDYLTKINALLEKHFFDLKKSPHYTRLKQSLMDNFKIMVKMQHEPGFVFDTKMTESFKEINHLIDLVQNDLDRDKSPLNLKQEATTLAYQSLFHTLQMENDRLTNFYADLTIWLHNKTIQTVMHDNFIAIHFYLNHVIPHDSYTEIPLPFYIEIKDGYKMIIDFPDLQTDTFKDQIIVTNLASDFKTYTTLLSVHNVTSADIYMNDSHLFRVNISLDKKGKPSPQPVKLFSENIDIQINYMNDHPTISLLDRIVNPFKCYSFLLHTNVYFVNSEIHDFLATDDISRYDLFTSQAGVINELKNNELLTKQEKEESDDAAGSPTTHNNDPLNEYPSPFSQEEKDMQIRLLLIEDDIRKSGKLTTQIIQQAQENDANCLKIKEKFKRQQAQPYVLKNNLVYKTRPHGLRLFLPSSLAPGILKHLHEHNFHPSPENLMDLFNKTFFTPMLQSWAKKIVQGCFVCVISKHQMLPGPTRTKNVRRRIDDYSYKPRMALSIDIILTESAVHRYGLVIMDLFSQYLFIKPMRNKSSKLIAEILHQHFMETDVPLAILSDQDASFSDEVSQLFFNYNVIHLTTYPYSQNLNMVESSTKAFKMALRLFLNQWAGAHKINQWHVYASRAISFINRRKLKGVPYTRYALFYGIDPNENNLFYDELLADTSDKMSQYLIQRDNLISTCHEIKLKMINSKTHSPKKSQFKKHDIVFLSEKTKHTLFPTYRGPFLILQLHPQGAQISDLRTNKVSYTHQRFLRKLDLSTYSQSFPKSVLQNFVNKTSREPYEIDPSPPLPKTDSDGPITRSRAKVIKSEQDSLTLQNMQPSLSTPPLRKEIKPLWTLPEGYSEKFKKICANHIKHIDKCHKVSRKEIILDNKPPGSEVMIIFKSFPNRPTPTVKVGEKRVRFGYVTVRYF